MQSSNFRSGSNQAGLSQSAASRQPYYGQPGDAHGDGPLEVAGQVCAQLASGLKGFAQQCCSGEAVQNVGSTERMFSTGVGGMLVASGLLRGRLPGLLLTALGGALLYRGVTGHCSLYQQLGISTDEVEGERSPVKGVKIEESVTIARSAQDLYEVWTQWERLPEILPHVDEVKDLGKGRTRWTARGPLGTRLTWEAEVIKQEPHRLIAWQSLNGGDIDTAGSVHFNAQGTESTDMIVSMQYQPPGGRLTALVSEFFGIGLEQRVRRDLLRFKAAMESSKSGRIQGADASTDPSEVPSGKMQRTPGPAGKQ